MKVKQANQEKYCLPLNLQLFGEEEAAAPGVEDVSAAETQETVTDSDKSGDQGAAAEPKEDVAFAKRFAAAEKKWQAEKEAELQALREQYKDFDTYKQATEYLQKSAGGMDLMTLKEEIELQALQERAEKENLTPEALKRIEILEAKAAKGDELQAQIDQEKAVQAFEQTLKTFVEGKEIDGKPVDHVELWNYMAENEISKPEIAFKAMKADLLEAKLATAKKDAVTEYLDSKKGVKADGAAGAAAQSTPTGGSWKDIEARAAARMRAAKQAE